MIIIENNNFVSKFLDNNFEEVMVNMRDENLKKYNLQIFPSNHNIFKCFNYFDINNTKIVILGQDPYHGINQATGLAFGINNLCRKQPSLKNIEKELLNDLNISLSDQTLEYWAKQNILLLNSALIVIEGKPRSHIKYWSNFTDNIINYININCKNVIFVAWGDFAYNKLKNINSKYHTLLVTSHPSPLSCYKKYKDYPAFSGSKIFSKINNCLINYNKTIINW